MSDPGSSGTGKPASPGRWAQARQGHHALLQLARYAVVGGGATLLQSALYALLTEPLGVQPANAVAWAICTVLSTIGHRWLTFNLQRRDTHRDLTVGITTSLVALGATAGALALLGPHDGFLGAAVVFGVLTVVGCLRFVVLRHWFVGRASAADPDGATLADPPDDAQAPDESAGGAGVGR